MFTKEEVDTESIKHVEYIVDGTMCMARIS